ncbi:MAG: hypothetical protein ABIR96_12825 [Bdellovibrionota bacterium]
MNDDFSQLKMYLTVTMLTIILAIGLAPKAHAGDRNEGDTYFHCWAALPSDDQPHVWKSDSDSELPEHILSVTGKIHSTGVVQAPVIVDIDGVQLSKFSGSTASAGEGYVMVEGMGEDPTRHGHLILRFLGEDNASNTLFYSRFTTSRQSDRAIVDSDDVKCHFIPVW